MDFLNYNTHLQVNPTYLQSSIKYSHFSKMNIKFNGIDRFEKRNSSYFRTIQPLEHGYHYPEKNIYMYSFSLYPNDTEISGSCNFSRWALAFGISIVSGVIPKFLMYLIAFSTFGTISEMR